MAMRCRYAGLSLMVLGCFASLAPVAGIAGSEEWDFSLTPYYWAVTKRLVVEYDGTSPPVTSDDLERSSVFKPNAVGTHVEGMHGDWGVLLSGLYTHADTPPGEGGLKGFTVNEAIVDLAAMYAWELRPEKRIRLDLVPYAGLRFQRLRVLTEQWDSEETRSVGRSGFSPLLGAKADLWLSDRALLSVYGDTSAFGWGDVPDAAWRGTVAGRWWLIKEFNLVAGYRWSGRRTEDSAKQFRLRDHSEGFFVGLGLDFVGQTRAPGTAGALPDEPSPPPSGPPEEGFMGWLVESHRSADRKFSEWIDWADRALVEPDARVLRREPARIYLGVEFEIEQSKDVKLGIKPYGDASLELPNLEREAKLIISSRSVSETPGTDLFEEDPGLTIGLERQGFFLDETTLRAGIRTSSSELIELEGKASWKPFWVHKRWFLAPEVTGYYRSSRGFGYMGHLQTTYHIKDRYRVSYVPAINDNEKAEYAQFAHNVVSIYLFEGNEEDYHRAFMSYFVCLGDVSKGPTEYRLEPMTYRAPLYRNWLYGYIGPRIRWLKERNWEADPGIIVGVEAMFWEGRRQ